MRESFVRCLTMAAVALTMALPAAAATQLTGAGSSFDYPFFSKAFYIYNEKHPDVTVNYQSIGSGGGIQQFTARNVDFGATDVPMNSSELARAGQPVLQIPVTLGGAAIAYNLPDVNETIRLTRQVVADIYLGKILKWNDPQIAKLNPKAKLPDMSIVVVHRSDGSGTSYIFTDFLSRVSGEWKSKVGVGKSVSWPAPSSVGAKGNEGVAGQVRSTPRVDRLRRAGLRDRKSHARGPVAESRREVGRVQYGYGRRRGRHQAGGKLDQLLNRRRERRELISRLRIFVDRGL